MQTWVSLPCPQTELTATRENYTFYLDPANSGTPYIKCEWIFVIDKITLEDVDFFTAELRVITSYLHGPKGRKLFKVKSQREATAFNIDLGFFNCEGLPFFLDDIYEYFAIVGVNIPPQSILNFV